MIQIHNEVSIELGDPHEQTLTLWLVSYGSPASTAALKQWPMFVAALRHFCGRQGWLMETGSDPYNDKSLAVFAEGFSWPPDDADDCADGHDDDDDWWLKSA